MSPAEKHFVRTELLPEHHAPSSLAAHVARLEARLGRRGDTLDVMAMTSALLARPDRDEARRRDFRSLRMITVDSASTVEIDDGLSAEVAGVDDVHGDVSLVRVFVHVADPTRYLDAEDGLAKVASGRVRTLYLPHGKRPMMPVSLGAEASSLLEGVGVPSLTGTAVVRLEEGSWVEGSGEVVMSVTQSSGRMTYDEVDRALEGADGCAPPKSTQTTGALLSLLSAVAAARKRWRTGQMGPAAQAASGARGAETGATDATDATEARGAAEATETTEGTEATEASILSVPGPGDAGAEHGEMTVTMTHAPKSSPSRELVMECMVLAGQVLATFGLENAIPLPYRSQEAVAYDPDGDEDDDKRNSVQLSDYRLRRYLLRSTLAASPDFLDPSRYAHHALGVPAYTQATSPIRRYVDLLAHWQIKAHLRGEGQGGNEGGTLAFDRDQLDAAIVALERTNQALTAAERAIDQAFLCAYAQTLPDPKTLPSCTLLHWINQERGLGILHVPVLGRDLVATLNRPAAVGTQLSCTVTAADPFTGTLVLTAD